MANKEKTRAESQDDTTNNYSLLNAAKKVFLASVGALALAQDELEDLINRMVERGEIAEKEGRELISEVKVQSKANIEKTEHSFEKRLNSILQRLDIPTKADVDSLSKKITALSKKIDEMKAQTDK